MARLTGKLRRELAVPELSEADDGKRFQVSLGEAIVVSLPENPTTGYRWELVDLDGALVRLERAVYEKAPSAAIGGGGRRLFVLLPHAPGTAVLRAVCRRSWASDDPLRAFGVVLEVEGDQQQGRALPP